jgi:hypothetical protein
LNRDFQDSHNFEVPAAGHEECEDDTCEVSEERDDLEEHPELIDVYHVPHSQR